MKSKIIIIIILLLLIIGAAVFVLRAKMPGIDIINNGKPMPVKNQAGLLEDLKTSDTQASSSVKAQEDILNRLAATSTASSSPQGPTEEEQKRILESLQAK